MFAYITSIHLAQRLAACLSEYQTDPAAKGPFWKGDTSLSHPSLVWKDGGPFAVAVSTLNETTVVHNSGRKTGE